MIGIATMIGLFVVIIWVGASIIHTQLTRIANALEEQNKQKERKK